MQAVAIFQSKWSQQTPRRSPENYTCENTSASTHFSITIHRKTTPKSPLKRAIRGTSPGPDWTDQISPFTAPPRPNKPPLKLFHVEQLASHPVPATSDFYFRNPEMPALRNSTLPVPLRSNIVMLYALHHQAPHLPPRFHGLHLPRLPRHAAPAHHVHPHRHPHRRHLCLRQHDQQAPQGLRPRVPRRGLRRRSAPVHRNENGRPDEGRAEVQHQDPGLSRPSTTAATRPTASKPRQTSSSSSPTSAAPSKPSASPSSTTQGFEADDVIGTLSCKLAALGTTKSTSSPPTRT